MDKITAEQVARALETPRHIDYRALGAGWRHRAPDYVVEAEESDDWDTEHDALTRWHAELVAAETPRALPPWTRVDCDRCGCSHMASRTEPRTVAHDAELLCGECQAYEAGERAAETPRKVARWDGESHWELSPAHTLSNMTVVTACDRAQAIAWGYEIEGGPEPIRFHPGDLVRVVNCTGSPDNGREFFVHKVEGSSVYETPNHSWTPYTLALVRAAEQPIDDTAPERLRERREALEPAPAAAPTRPEPRYKVGDWVRVITSGSEVYDGEVIAPAIDPALRETARTAARMLLCGKWPMHLPRVRELPGFDAWNIGPLKSSEWAAQLERLLGDAP